MVWCYILLRRMWDKIELEMQSLRIEIVTLILLDEIDPTNKF
jgi:hypothetical protein